MKTLDVTLADPAENLALDEALLDAAESGSGGEVLRFWEPERYFVVVGYGNRAGREANLGACGAAGVPVLRRCSGGGTVLQGPGCLNYSLVLRVDPGEAGTISAVNRRVMERHAAWLSALLQRRVEVRGHTDLAIGERKFSGNAQRRHRSFLLFHGTFLLHFDLARMGGLLAAPSLEPEYRQGRGHGEFVMNLEVEASRVREALRAGWGAEAVLERVPDLDRWMEERYGRTEWHERY